MKKKQPKKKREKLVWVEMKWDLAEPPTLRSLTCYVTTLRQRSVTHLTVNRIKAGFLKAATVVLCCFPSGKSSAYAL